MDWLLRYRLHLYLHQTVWVAPVLGMFIAIFASAAIHQAQDAFSWGSSVNPEGTRAVLVTLASAMFTFIVFVSSTLLLALQLASAQLTPRAISIVFSDPVAKVSSTVFVFTFTFVISVTVRMDEAVPLLTARLAAYCCIASVVVFFYLIDHMGKALRPSEVLRWVGMSGRKVIENVYRHRLGDSPAPVAGASEIGSSTPDMTIPAAQDGMLLACDAPGLIALTRRFGCVVELVPQIGDFIARGDPLFRVYAGSAPALARALRRKAAIGHERTMEQDPAFAFRIIVDIAAKALSPAINDPTTAVIAIDQIHHLLREVGQRRLDDERIGDGAGHLRLIYRTPSWEDLVHLAVTEIRQFGCQSIQVMRRLRAMLEDLIATLPQERAALLQQELSLLDRSVARFFQEPEDLAFAEISDAQGVGGRAGVGCSLKRERRPHTADVQVKP